MSAMHVCDSCLMHASNACLQCMPAMHVCNAEKPSHDGMTACKWYWLLVNDFLLDSVNRIRSLLWKIWMVLKEQI